MKRFNPKTVTGLLSCALVMAMLIGVITGAVALPLVSVFSADTDPVHSTILIDIRLPRVLLAALVGSILAMSGAVMQGLFRNPLADPSLIGVTAGASLGASVVIVFFSAVAQQWIALSLVSLGAFVGGALAVIVVYRLSSRVDGTSVATMLLAGIAITALTGSIASLLAFFADNEMLRRISLWRMGGLDGANYYRVAIIASVGLVLFALLPRYSNALNALLLGESEARHLGVNTERLKTIAIVLVAAGVGIAVAMAGVIGFVGLVVPHILRLLIGPDHRWLLPASALGGALLLVVADTVSRVVLAPVELPVGLITALIGVPFFISLLQRRYVYGL